MTKTILSLPVFLSPFILYGILLETSENDAYPPEADSSGIALFGYLLFYFPVALYLLSKVRGGRLHRPRVWLWNRERHVFSAVSLFLSIFPLGLFWLAFLLVGFSSESPGTILASLLLLTVTCLVRTFAIQPAPTAEHGGVDQSSHR